MQSSEQPMKTPYELRVIDTDEIEKALVGIVSGFVWDSTPQGHAYWQGVYNALTHIQSQAALVLADNEPCLL